MAPFVPEVQDIYRAVKAGKAMLWPVLKERQERMKNEPDWTPPEDFVTWVAQGSKNGWDPSKHIQAQMGIGLASLHTRSVEKPFYGDRHPYLSIAALRY